MVIRLWRSSGKYFPLFHLIKLLPFFPSPFPVSFKLFILYKYLPVLCSSFWLLCPEVKQPSLLPANSLCLANVTKRRLSCWHAPPPWLATQNRSIVRKRPHWFRCSFILPCSYTLSQLTSLGLRALYFVLTASLHSVWGEGRICMTHLPFYFSVLVPVPYAYWLCLGFFL